MSTAFSVRIILSLLLLLLFIPIVSSDNQDDPALSKPSPDIVVSPKHMFRIEQLTHFLSNKDVWVVSNTTERRKQLPLPEDEATTGRGQPTSPLSKFEISPDEKWIFRTEQFYHGMTGAYLYEGASDLNYKRATDLPLDLLAWKYFNQTTGSSFADNKLGGVVNLVAWKPDSLRISLNASKRLTFADVNDWEVGFDLETKTFSIPQELIEHDRNAYSPK